MKNNVISCVNHSITLFCIEEAKSVFWRYNGNHLGNIISANIAIVNISEFNNTFYISNEFQENILTSKLKFVVRRTDNESIFDCYLKNTVFCFTIVIPYQGMCFYGNALAIVNFCEEGARRARARARARFKFT